jgi:hypothetical protein
MICKLYTAWHGMAWHAACMRMLARRSAEVVCIAILSMTAANTSIHKIHLN